MWKILKRNKGIKSVTYFIDDTLYHIEDVTKPFRRIWNPCLLNPGKHTLKVDVSDFAKHITSSNEIEFYISPDLKLDCEGSEYTIIDTLPLDYFKRISKMAIEYHFTSTKPELSEGLIKKIKNSGFHVKLLPNYDDMGFLYAIKETS